MADEYVTPSGRFARLIPRAGVRTQLVSAALMWLIGSTILLVRGLGYVHDRYWHAWALAAGLALGVVKSKALLDRVARKAVDRIRSRGKGRFLGFFSLRSWLLIGVMMGGGITLRHVFAQPGAIGAGVLGAIYVGVGTALLLGDRIFWQAVFEPRPMDPGQGQGRGQGRGPSTGSLQQVEEHSALLFHRSGGTG